jgi:hypothetical protein
LPSTLAFLNQWCGYRPSSGPLSGPSITCVVALKVVCDLAGGFVVAPLDPRLLDEGVGVPREQRQRRGLSSGSRPPTGSPPAGRRAIHSVGDTGSHFTPVGPNSA